MYWTLNVKESTNNTSTTLRLWERQLLIIFDFPNTFRPLFHFLGIVNLNYAEKRERSYKRIQIFHYPDSGFIFGAIRTIKCSLAWICDFSSQKRSKNVYDSPFTGSYPLKYPGQLDLASFHAWSKSSKTLFGNGAPEHEARFALMWSQLLPAIIIPSPYFPFK